MSASAESSAPRRGVTATELEARLARARREMDAGGLDVLLLTEEADVRWLSGFLTPFWLSPTRPWFLLVPASGTPVAVIPEIGVDLMRRTWIGEIRAWPSPRPEDDGTTLLAATLEELLGARARVGLPMGGGTALRMPLSAFERLRALLPGARWCDATAPLARARQVKSESEIAKIGHVCRLVSDVFATLPERLAIGTSAIEVCRMFRIGCLEAGVDEVPYLVCGVGSDGYEDVISPPDERPLAPGDVLMLDVGATFDGYFCDFDRNHAVCTIDPRVDDAYRLLWDATEAGLVAARPGARCSDLFAAMDRVIRAARPRDTDAAVGRYGHGLGLQLTEPPSVAPFDDTVLETGMVLTLEPGLALGDGRVMVHEENLVVREGGAELLTRRAPERLPRIGR